MVDNVSSVKTEHPPVVVPPGSKPEMYRAFFQPLVNILREEHGFNPMKGGSKNWKSFSAPGLPASVSYRVIFDGNRQVMVNIFIDRNDREWNEQLFDKLEERKGAIECKLGKSLSWQRMDKFTACRVLLHLG